MEFNPVVTSVIVLCILCLFRVNVLFSLMISSIIAGILAKMPVSKIMDLFISGMGQNSETALSYILLGALAAAMTHTGLTEVLSIKIAEFIKQKRKEVGLTQEEFALRSGLGLRFIRELEQGKQTVRMDKVNQALAMFGMEAVPGRKVPKQHI